MTNISQKLLSNVVVIRVILVVLLVFYHAFAPYSGAWEPVVGFPDIKAYWWMDWLAYAFMLEAFVFVSGYVFGYQVRTKGSDKLKINNLLWGKFKRLMIPCSIFSLLYILLLGDIREPFYKTLYDLFNGVGHMWFLPMLFWCFVAIWIIEKVQLKPRLVIPLLVLASVFSFVPLPFQLTATMYYLVFFYGGYIIQKENIQLERFFTAKYCITSICAFCILFPALTMLKYNLVVIMGGGIIEKSLLVVTASACNMARLIYSSVGLIMLFVIVGALVKRRNKSLPNWLVKASGLCMGVYLFQQFLLKGMYDYTNFPAYFGCYWLPWVGFALALLGSVTISYFLGKTKIGKFLIG